MLRRRLVHVEMLPFAYAFVMRNVVQVQTPFGSNNHMLQYQNSHGCLFRSWVTLCQDEVQCHDRFLVHFLGNRPRVFASVSLTASLIYSRVIYFPVTFIVLQFTSHCEMSVAHHVESIPATERAYKK